MYRAIRHVKIDNSTRMITGSVRLGETMYIARARTGSMCTSRRPDGRQFPRAFRQAPRMRLFLFVARVVSRPPNSSGNAFLSRRVCLARSSGQSQRRSARIRLQFPTFCSRLLVSYRPLAETTPTTYPNKTPTRPPRHTSIQAPFHSTKRAHTTSPTKTRARSRWRRLLN